MSYTDGIDSSVDYKWRLYLPSEIKEIPENIFLEEDWEGCVRIFLRPQLGTVKRKVSTTKTGIRRVTIPKSLRKSESFFFGKKVRLTFDDYYINILPRK